MNYDLTGIILEFFMLSIAGIAFGFVVILSVLGARLLIMSAAAQAKKVGEISKIPSDNDQQPDNDQRQATSSGRQPKRRELSRRQHERQ